jgi:glutaredoxin-like protein
VIPLKDQEYLHEKFARELARQVRIDFFTQKESSLFLPGRQPCQYCKPTRQMLEEVAALSDLISLRQHTIDEDREAFTRHGVDKIPAVVLPAGDGRWLKYYGFPGGHEFLTLVETIVDLSRGARLLADGVRKRLRKLKKDVLIQVFVTPSCPYCPQMARLAFHMALESPLITAEVIEAQEFPELSQQFKVRAVPTTVVSATGGPALSAAGNITIPGAVPDTVLMDIIERVGQPAPLAEAPPEPGPTTPAEQPKAVADGKIILP